MKELLINKKIIISFFCFLAIIIALNISFRDIGDTSEGDYRYLTLLDTLVIFSFNTFTGIITFLFIPLGTGFLLPISFINSIISYSFSSPLNLLLDFITLLPHGLFELFMVYILFNLNCVFFSKVLWGKEKGFSNRFNSACGELYKSSTKKVAPLIIIILVFGALIETFISNRLFIFFN